MANNADDIQGCTGRLLSSARQIMKSLISSASVGTAPDDGPAARSGGTADAEKASATSSTVLAPADEESGSGTLGRFKALPGDSLFTQRSLSSVDARTLRFGAELQT